MGRQIRKVPHNWEHPKDAGGNLIPLMDGFNATIKEWDEESAQWAKGFKHRYRKDEGDTWVSLEAHDEKTYEEYAGGRPVKQEYMPDWPESERTWWQMYEDCSEGTPISPPMESPECLARWLCDNGASALAGETASYEAWLQTCKDGWAPSAIMDMGQGIQSGVEASLNREVRLP